MSMSFFNFIIIIIMIKKILIKKFIYIYIENIESLQ